MLKTLHKKFFIKKQIQFYTSGPYILINSHTSLYWV